MNLIKKCSVLISNPLFFKNRTLFQIDGVDIGKKNGLGSQSKIKCFILIQEHKNHQSAFIHVLEKTSEYLL